MWKKYFNKVDRTSSPYDVLENKDVLYHLRKAQVNLAEENASKDLRDVIMQLHVLYI